MGTAQNKKDENRKRVSANDFLSLYLKYLMT